MSQSLVVGMGITPMPKQVPIALAHLQTGFAKRVEELVKIPEKVQRLIAEKYDRRLIYIVEFFSKYALSRF